MKGSTMATLPETNIAPENRGPPKGKVIFQPSIFWGELSVSGSVSFLSKTPGIHHKFPSPECHVSHKLSPSSGMRVTLMVQLIVAPGMSKTYIN